MVRRRPISLLTNLHWWWDLSAADSSIASQTANAATLDLEASGITTSSTGAPDGGACIAGTGDGLYRSPSTIAKPALWAGDYTINLWRYKTAAADMMFFNHRDVSGRYPQMMRLSARDSLYHVSGGSFVEAGTTAGSTNTWAMLTGIRRGSDIELWVNGSLITTVGGTSAPSATAAYRLAIGGAAWDGGGLRFQGRLFGVGVWGEALDSTKITALYNGGAGRRYSSLT
jgi:hypothetical protein